MQASNCTGYRADQNRQWCSSMTGIHTVKVNAEVPALAAHVSNFQNKQFGLDDPYNNVRIYTFSRFWKIHSITMRIRTV
jgi:hypothetical protein